MHFEVYNPCLRGMGRWSYAIFATWSPSPRPAPSRAATRLGLTQPALSRQVRNLEVELGVRLFERAGRRVSLTSDGEGLLQRIMPAYAKAFIDEITAYTRRTYPGRQYDRRAPPVPRPRP